MTIDELRSKTTISVPEAGRVLGVSPKSAYSAAASGAIPTLRLGARLVVPVPALLLLLGDGLPAPAEGVKQLREVTP